MGPKMSYLDILNWNIKKEKQQNLLTQVPNQPLSYKGLKFGTMIFIFCCFRHMLRLELAKAIATFQINTPKIIKIQRIMETGKKLNLVLKAHYAGILQKQFCRTGNQHPRF